MTRLGRTAGWFALLLALIAFALPVHSSTQSSTGPRLLVLIVFDQMRGDYLQRWYEHFSHDGFRRMRREGAWFTNCHYPYSLTVTGPGHASLGTGCLPSQHGIVENDWFDRRDGKTVYCATYGERFTMVPAGSKSKSGKSHGGAPTRLLMPTVGDLVKEATAGRGRVIGLALKDRGGVLPTGKKADLCFWYDDHQGAFVTSTYYADQLPRYMQQFNALKLADRWYGRDWTHLRGDLDYARYSSIDDIPGEGEEKRRTTTFPHDMTGGEAKLGNKFYNAVYSSPFGNELTWEAAKVVLEGERLGQDDDVDFLAVSFSSNDAVGHLYGPDSQEVLDITLRSDLIMADVIRYLDEKVGREHYVLALSADHGICPLPEIARRTVPHAGRIDPKPLAAALEAHLNLTYGTRFKWIETITGGGIYLRHSVLRAAAQPRPAVEEVCRAWLLAQPFVQAVYTRTQLLTTQEGDARFQQVKGSFHPERSPDVMPVLKPFVFTSGYKTGTTHGSPHSYDTHVPLLVLGGGVKPQLRDERVIPQAAAVILARSIGQKLHQAVIEAPAGLFIESK